MSNKGKNKNNGKSNKNKKGFEVIKNNEENISNNYDKPKLTVINTEENKQNKKNNYKDILKDKKNHKYFVILACIIFFGFILFTFSKNANQVFVGDNPVAIIRKDSNLTKDTVEQAAKAKLATELGVKDIKIDQPITFKPIHVRKRNINTEDQALTNITRSITYKVEGMMFVINNKDILAVASSDEANEIEDELKKPYDKEDQNLVEIGFVEDLKVVPKYVNEDDILSKEEALDTFKGKTKESQVYKLKQGDTLFGVAMKYGMSLKKLLEINPGMTENSLLQIGDKINVSVSKPMLSVVTYEEVTYDQILKKPVEKKTNDKEYISYSKVLQEGKDGKASITEKIKRVNGIETGREQLHKQIISEPVKEIVEVGTSKTPPKYALGSFIYPVRGRITDYFGARRGEHKGIDISASYGSSVWAADGGVVSFSGKSSGYGNLVIINHENGYSTYYGHNSSILVKVGERVSQGEVIAKVGSTGRSTGNHVHFEVVKNGTKENPLKYLS